ncbi:hypothetical protein HYV50_04240 [Candidatus Pacearchaeota archaeon]|nr:hypothetical protein [Candidatus Pacearchaeota archaeon]
MKKANIKAMALSTIMTIVFITFITVYAELNSVLKDFLTKLTTHHWISKSLLAITVFAFSYILLDYYKEDKPDDKNILMLVLIFVILGTLAILGFFVYEFF